MKMFLPHRIQPGLLPAQRVQLAAAVQEEGRTGHGGARGGLQHWGH